MLQIQVTRWHELQYMPDFYKGSGTYSYQLVFSRSKVVPDGLSQPRPELLAATLNKCTGEIVKRAFQDNHKGSVKLSDSQVTLH